MGCPEVIIMKNSVQPVIYKSVPHHVDAIKAIADANRAELGFILRAQIEEAVVQDRVFIALIDQEVVGFVIYRHRKKDLQTTIADICVAEKYRGQGVGKNLIDALLKESAQKFRAFIQLKCPANLPANDFYRKFGFYFISAEPGKSRMLNIWRFQVAHGD
jgi:ribosomal protein S18 acetylase RimI-like enzyme